jgi:D-alanyl-lipoteichoic acid acyltransferase DltB (MBOAT superfamily)
MIVAVTVPLLAMLRPYAPGLLAGAAATLVLLATHPARRLKVLPGLGVAIAVFVYGGGIAGVVLLHGAAFWFARALTGAQWAGARGEARRWQLARVAMAVLAAVALLGRAAGWMSWQIPVSRFEWAPLYLDVLMFARLEALLWEVGSGRVTRVNLEAFVTWSALPLGLFGPMLRFSEWLAQDKAGLEDPGSDERRRALRLLGLGFAQLAALLVLVTVRPALTPAGGVLPLWLKVADWFGFNPWRFYLGAAGYSNLLIAAGAWTGIRLPTVFDRPFGRPNLSAFWANWNIPVTSLARDVMFYGRWGVGRGDAYVSAIAVFLVIGLWHAGNAYWVVWGLMHGVGYCVFLAYTRRLRAGDHLARSVQAIVPGGLVTYLFVCGCWAFAPQVVRLLRAL